MNEQIRVVETDEEVIARAMTRYRQIRHDRTRLDYLDAAYLAVAEPALPNGEVRSVSKAGSGALWVAFIRAVKAEEPTS